MLKICILLTTAVTAFIAVNNIRIRRDGKAVQGQGEMPSIIKEVGDDPTNSFELEDAPGTKNTIYFLLLLFLFIKQLKINKMHHIDF
jgi:hypothetical protein